MKFQVVRFIPFCLVLLITIILAVSARSKPRPTLSYAVSKTGTTVTPKLNNAVPQANTRGSQTQEPFIDSVSVHSDIQFSYSRTKVVSTIVNPSASASHEVTFNVTLPEKAFISAFSMMIGSDTYKSLVARHEDAKEIYEDAVKTGRSAGLVETRNAHVFTVSSNVEASETITFTLTYEELLQRRFDLYEQVIHIDPDLVLNANNYSLTTTVLDSHNITLLRMIWRVEEDDIDEEMEDVTLRLDGNIGLMTWSPNPEFMKEDIPQRLVLQYDINHHPAAGRVILRDGHFVHFFSPQASVVQPKHIIFVLDISGSMRGVKLMQLKEAMRAILRDLHASHKNDYFSIVTFHSKVKVWMSAQNISSFPTTQRNIQAAISFIDTLRALHLTNIHDALISALNVASTGETLRQHKKADPIIMFLTDGYPTFGIKNQDQVLRNVSAANKDQRVPVFSLAFGQGADFAFLRKLSLQNGAIARKIYEASDAALQLQNFYSEISSPALSNVNFTYTSDLLNVTGLTRTRFSRFFKGSEIVVVGRLESNDPCASYCVDGKLVAPKGSSPESTEESTWNAFDVVVTGSYVKGIKVLDSADVLLCENRTVSASDAYRVEDLFDQDGKENFMERLWAYLTIKQLIEEAEADSFEPFQNDTGATDDENPAQRALDLSLQYEFVTPLTSLVVVRPDFGEDDELRLPSSSNYAEILKALKVPQAQAGTKSADIFQTNRISQCQTRDSAILNASTEFAQKPGETSLDLQLNDITWLNPDADVFALNNGMDSYWVAREGQTDDDAIIIDGVDCGSEGGTCTHLKNCVLPDFLNDFNVYVQDYLCEIDTPAGAYAGVCCPAGGPEIR